jgi:hypothetical protein
VISVFYTVREKARRSLAFSRVSKPHTHITHMLRQCTCIVYVQESNSKFKCYDICLKSYSYVLFVCLRLGWLRNAGKGEALPRLFPRFAPNTHIYLYTSTVHMYCIYPAILNPGCETHNVSGDGH